MPLAEQVTVCVDRDVFLSFFCDELGGVSGSFGVQLAKALGATVVATSGARNMDRVARLGADEVLDYRSTNWGVTLAGRDFDVVYDCIGGYRHWLDGLRVLRAGGHYVTIVGDVPGNSFSNLIAKVRWR